MELENIILSEVTEAQKVKSHMFYSYVDYRPKTNAVILLGMGSMYSGGIGKRKES
jgi:hypothetical protein